VAEEDGRVVGFIFSRTWGSVGWFGTFAVLPAYQRRGTGKRLITASLGYLRRDPGRLIGLETTPASAYNLGLYLRQGFQPRWLTFTLARPLDQSAAGAADLARWSSVDAGTRERWLDDLREATGQVRPGLDYAKEIVSTDRHGLGETLVLTDGGRAVGVSLVWLAGLREGVGEELARVQVLALHPAHTDEARLRTLLDATEALAHAHGKQRLTVPVNARHAWALERLLGWGYRVEGARVRMVLKGTGVGLACDDAVELSPWAG